MLASVPTFTEQGVADVDVIFWFGIVAPAGTPPDIIARLNKDLAASVDEPAVKTRFVQQGIDVATGTPQQFGDVIARGAVQWRDVVAAIGIKQQ